MNNINEKDNQITKELQGIQMGQLTKLTKTSNLTKENEVAKEEHQVTKEKELTESDKNEPEFADSLNGIEVVVLLIPIIWLSIGAIWYF